jgi:hypothetical protein
MAPFLISANDDIAEWKIVGKSGNSAEYPAEWLMQESVASNFVRNWFKISTYPAENEAAWKLCDRMDCGLQSELGFDARECAIYCASGDELFSRFSQEVLANYKNRADNGEIWRIDENKTFIAHSGKISEQGGTWRINATVISQICPPETDAGDAQPAAACNAEKLPAAESFKISVFIKIARNKNNYPKTLGFYVADFNAYRTN